MRVPGSIMLAALLGATACGQGGYGGGGTEPPGPPAELAQSVTNASGVATTLHTLGPTEASQSVTATVTNLPPQTFTAAAVAAPTSMAVDLIGNTFRPADTAVVVGGTVTWTWRDNPVLHNVTFTAGPTPRPANSTTQAEGTYSATFSTVGTYDYTCTLHAGMNGRMHVVNP